MMHGLLTQTDSQWNFVSLLFLPCLFTLLCLSSHISGETISTQSSSDPNTQKLSIQPGWDFFLKHLFCLSLARSVLKTDAVTKCDEKKLDPRQVLEEPVPDAGCSMDWYEHVN